MRRCIPSTLVVGWLSMFVIGSDVQVLSPLLPAIVADFQVSVATAGLCATAFSLTYMLSAPVFGLISDRIGRRQVLICSLAGFTAANLLLAAAANLPLLLAARAAAGAAAAGAAPNIYALVVESAPPDRRATWLGIVVSGIMVSTALGAPAAALVADSLSWRPVFFAIATASLGLLWLNRRHWPRPHGGVGVAPERLPTLSETLLARRLLPTVMWSTALYGMYTYLGVGLAASGLDGAQMARAILIYGCGAIAGALICGRVSDSFGSRFTMSAALGGLCVCLLALRAAIEAGFAVGPVLGVTSIFAQLFFPAQQAGLVNDFASRRATVLAWNNSAYFLGIMLGSLIGGPAIAGGGFSADLAICGVVALVGCITSLIVVPSPAPLAAKSTNRPA